MSYSGVKGLRVYNNKKHPEDKTKGDVHTLFWGGNSFFMTIDLDTQIYLCIYIDRKKKTMQKRVRILLSQNI